VGKVYDGIDARLAAWIAERELFFVGTAPSGEDGHVNVSPKGPIDSLHLLDERTVAYLDVVGSGAETIAHLRQNGRIVIMLCAFQGPPRILRLHGRGSVLVTGEPGFEAAAADFALPLGVEAATARRAVIRVDVERVADSCGYGVPLMDVRGVRPQYPAWVDRTLRRGAGALDAYMAENNARSLDGLPAVDPAPTRSR
jgi:Pyridoxamine 5'-phosphate oxidase